MRRTLVSLVLASLVGCDAENAENAENAEIAADDLSISDALFTSECTQTCDVYRTSTVLVFDVTSATDGPLELVWEERLVGGQPDYTWYDPIASVNLELKAGKVETVEMRQVIQQCSPRYDQREGTSVFVMTANGEPLEFEGQTLLFGDSEDCSVPPG